jgi:hypothetical protein
LLWIVLAIGGIGAAAGAQEIGYAAAVLMCLGGIWHVMTAGVGDDELRDVLEHHQDEYGG